MTTNDGIIHVADARGDLVAVELASLDFTAQRVFVASGAQGGSERGNHLVPCAQLMVLVSGRAEVWIGGDASLLGSGVALAVPGDSIRLPEGQFVRYRLEDASSAVLVLAEAPYRSDLS